MLCRWILSHCLSLSFIGILFRTIKQPAEVFVCFRAGDVVDSLVGIREMFESQFTVDDIEWLLETTLQAHALMW